MKFGLTPPQYKFISEAVVEPLRRNGNEVYCFGSRAREDHKPFSDLDLMVEGKADCRSLIATMKDTLSESNFPYKVDIVLLDELATSYLEGYKRDRKAW